ncbi:FHF complex subunit HOOK interacting protein 2A-like [Condylostylus longicornis]|uniref:FHF complex subunit HOOK interacting protein 2A-like n=1 Tax=Condylostylus longicornis TaxID=2530218 RepID=UPI00244E1315|nr:FHF complex subunit HOOK interacting protein 2A-like [Condylostylus longicornis]
MLLTCNSLSINVMLQGLSDVLKTAADIVAPPPTLRQDLEYHWKQVKTFYNNRNNFPRHISNTTVPHHLESILQTILREDELENNDSKKECMEFILNNRPLDLLLELSIADSPPGVKVCVLNWVRRFLSCTKSAPLEHTSIFEPIRNLIQICNGKVPSPYEEEEILFLETIAGLIRKNPNLLHIFLPSHQYSASAMSQIKHNKFRKLPESNSLFQSIKLETNIRRVEIIPDLRNINSNELKALNKAKIANGSNFDFDTKCNASIKLVDLNRTECDCEQNEKFELLDTILSYFESPDSKVVVRACESALILSSLSVSNIKCTSFDRSLKDFTDYLIKKICVLYEKIPDDMDSDNIEEGNISWGFIPREPDVHKFIGKAEFHEFFCWLDYTDCVALENLKISTFITQFRNEFLLKYVEPTLLATDTPFVLIILSKIIRQIRSPNFMDEIANWLVGETNSEPYSATDCLLTIIIENMQDNSEILLAGLQFIEALLDNPNEKILNEMLFRYLNKRGYYDNQAQQSWSDEEEERERKCGSIEDQFRSHTLSPHNILKVINHFLLLLPRQVMAEASGTCYEEYVQDASKHYKIWLKKTEKFAWPREAVSPDREIISSSSSIGNLDLPKSTFRRSNSLETDLHCNDSGISEGRFYEGPLLKFLFSHVKGMPNQSCEINLAVIAIVSKLAFLPQPYLHEILLNPIIPVAHGATNLWNNMQVAARYLLLEIPKHEHFQKRIGETGKRLLSNPPIICDEGNDDIEQLYEAIVILEEFCKELAAIAFVKYHHATKE